MGLRWMSNSCFLALCSTLGYSFSYTKIQVYRACVLSTLLYCSESWTLCARQERKFHMRCLQHIFGSTWQDNVPNRVVLERAGIFSMYTLLKQLRLCWLRHVVRMANGQIPKDLLYEELVQGNRLRGRPQLQYQDTVVPRIARLIGSKKNIAMGKHR